MTGNTAFIDSINKCLFNNPWGGCFKLSTLALIILVTSILMIVIVLTPIICRNNKNKDEENFDEI